MKIPEYAYTFSFHDPDRPCLVLLVMVIRDVYAFLSSAKIFFTVSRALI